MGEIEYIDRVVKCLRDSDRYIETIFLNGGCYRFHHFLKSMYPEAEPYMDINKGHVVTKLFGKFFDITGVLSERREWIPMTDEDREIAKEWSFSKNNFLVADECEFCGEPIPFLI